MDAFNGRSLLQEINSLRKEIDWLLSKGINGLKREIKSSKSKGINKLTKK